MKKKESLQRPSERLLAAQRGEIAPSPLKGNATLHTMAEILTLANYTSTMIRDGCRATMAEIKQGLGYENAPVLERLLIDQLVMCWLRVGEAEAMYSQIMGASHDFDKAVYAEKRLTACLGRYTRVVESLARIRQDIIPAVQVNIAGQQIVMGAK
jgi:hypothetical protein